jgi:putative peptidoglycan lipid II flippase
LFLITILLKIVDVIKNLIIVYMFGISDHSDIYFGLVSLPEGIVVLLGFDTIRGVANSEFSSQNAGAYSKEVIASFQNLLKIMSILGIILLGLLYLFKDIIVRMYLPGFNGEKMQMTNEIANFILPIFLFKVLIGYLTAVNNSVKRFYFPILSTSIISILVVVSIYIKYFMGVLIYNLAIANLIGNIACTVILLIGSYKFFSNFSLFDLHIDVLSKRILRGCMSVLGLVFINQLYSFSRNMFTSYFPDGALTSINYASSITGIINMLVITSIFSVMLTNLSEYLNNKKVEEARNLFWNTLLTLFYLIVPLIVLFVVADSEIISLLYLRGNFEVKDINLVIIPFIWESLALSGFALNIVSIALFLAMKKYKLLTLIGFSVYALGILLNYVFSLYFGYIGICIVSFITSILYGVLLILNTRKFWDLPWLYIGKLISILVCGILTFILSIFAFSLFEESGISVLSLFTVLSMKISVLAVLYLVFTSIMKVNYFGKLVYLYRK